MPEMNGALIEFQEGEKEDFYWIQIEEQEKRGSLFSLGESLRKIETKKNWEIPLMDSVNNSLTQMNSLPKLKNRIKESFVALSITELFNIICVE